MYSAVCQGHHNRTAAIGKTDRFDGYYHLFPLPFSDSAREESDWAAETVEGSFVRERAAATERAATESLRMKFFVLFFSILHILKELCQIIPILLKINKKMISSVSFSKKRILSF